MRNKLGKWCKTRSKSIRVKKFKDNIPKYCHSDSEHLKTHTTTFTRFPNSGSKIKKMLNRETWPSSNDNPNPSWHLILPRVVSDPDLELFFRTSNGKQFPLTDRNMESNISALAITVMPRENTSWVITSTIARYCFPNFVWNKNPANISKSREIARNNSLGSQFRATQFFPFGIYFFPGNFAPGFDNFRWRFYFLRNRIYNTFPNTICKIIIRSILWMGKWIFTSKRPEYFDQNSVSYGFTKITSISKIFTRHRAWAIKPVNTSLYFGKKRG